MTITISKVSKNKLANSIAIEIDLLLSCAKSNLEDETKDRISILLENEIDWQYLLEVGKRHKILPLICSNLSKIKSKNLESQLYNNFQQVLQNNIQRNFLLTSELLQILKFLEDNAVKAIPVKGPVLATSAYGNFGLRSISDLDIIVQKRDFAKTQQLLIDRGYTASSLNKEEYYQQAQYYKQTSILIGIDLHYEFAPKNHFAAVDSDLFWENLSTIKIANRQVEVFALDYTIVHLCLEGAKEHWRSLSRICDLSELISHQSIDWKSLLKTADLLDKQVALFVGLYLARTLFKISIPEDIWLKINLSLKIKLSKEEIHNFLFRRKFDLPVAIKWYLFNLQVSTSPSEKLKYIRQAVGVNLKVNFNKKFHRSSIEIAASKF